MSLAPVYETMFAFITGAADHEEAATELFGEARSREARRLNVYRRSYLGALSEHVAKLFPITQKVVESKLGKRGWGQLLQAVGARGPLPDLRFGASVLVEILSGPLGAELRLPPWLAELADFEVWRRRIFLAPDVEPRAGVSVNPVLAIREYTHDVRRVALAPDPTVLEAVAASNVVAIWRTDEGERRTRPLGRVELAILRDVEAEGELRPEAIATSTGVDLDHVKRAVDRLADLELLTGIEKRCRADIPFVRGLCSVSERG